VLRTLITGIDMPGYASLMTAILFFGGLQLLSLGVLGEYVGRVLIETKRRPLYVVREEIGDAGGRRTSGPEAPASLPEPSPAAREPVSPR
jgi:polyisoprenyl-phosphate glycosyltransferase